ncbi:DUF5709 domain-containing protein [Amycolatopsis sp. H20-H5]|uniref:DUF5709 domain-containing protein n=1 Tax=Amycolatopsis sp. H20-H5 TaxID=3046309 RepID=UPI002DBEFD75|nr:DUF5709 domain-containing protein [Amycolatopsis sp. H20-H5]MEC3976416.1 DUF5709 domain-containing protein [Amycolatopsis sp. H20-H5]
MGSDYEDNAGGGQLDPDDTLEDRGVEDALDEGYSPPERPWAVQGWGTTEREERVRESWDGRLAREVPEDGEPGGDQLGDVVGAEGELVDPEAGDRRAGRLIAFDGGGWSASDIGIDGGAASAEEAAIHIVGPPD